MLRTDDDYLSSSSLRHCKQETDSYYGLLPCAFGGLYIESCGGDKPHVYDPLRLVTINRPEQSQD